MTKRRPFLSRQSLKIEKIGGRRTDAAFAPFRGAGRLLYDGPWLAERLHATEALLDKDPAEILPVTRSIIEKGRSYNALDAYRAQYELARLRREADFVFESIDVMLLPTTGTIYETTRWLRRTRSASTLILVCTRHS